MEVLDKIINKDSGSEKSGDRVVEFLKEIVKRDDYVSNISSDISNFKTIYDNSGTTFTHSYSKLTKFLCVELFESNQLDNLNKLSDYLKILVNHDEIKNNITLKGKLVGLIEHIELETCRLEIFKKTNTGVNNAATEAKNAIKNAETAAEKAKDAEKKAKKAGREAKKLKRELVVILGILATILIGSVGTMVYSASVFSGLKDMPATKLMFGILLVGSLFIVVFGMMFSFLREMCGDDDVASEVKNAGFSAKKPNLFLWAFRGVWHWILTFFTAVVVVSVAYLLTNCLSNLLPKIFHKESLKTIKTIKTEPQNFSQNQNFTQNATFAK